MSELLLAGASGLIGSKLIIKLKQKNIKYVLLSTQKKLNGQNNTLYWNPESNEFPDIDLKRFDACINFCGAGIFDKAFTDGRKEILLKSRVVPIQFLKSQFEKQNVTLPNFISASGTGFYPNICLNELDEDSTSGDGYIAQLVQNWENASLSFKPVAERVSIMRIGIVLAKSGGFLAQLSTPIKFFIGAVPGSGKQMISWVHIDDLCEAYIHLYVHQLEGIYNGVAPEPANLTTISKQTAKALKRPLFLPNIPAFVLRLIFGKGRSELLLTDQRVSSKKLESSGFIFQFTNSEQAIYNLIN
ncbi:MAG: TIGR01777 family oxidoreductase [Bacteroidia bacterium]